MRAFPAAPSQVVMPVKARLVVVAEVEVEFVMDKLEMVEEAKDMRPFEKVMRVVVALLTKG